MKATYQNILNVDVKSSYILLSHIVSIQKEDKTDAKGLFKKNIWLWQKLFFIKLYYVYILDLLLFYIH